MSFELIYRTQNIHLQRETNTFLHAWIAGIQEVAVSTSGSTGPPKQLILKRQQLEASARRTLDYFKLQPGETVVSCLSPDTIGGKMMIVRAVIGKLRLIIVEPSATPLVSLKPEDRPVFCPMVPLQAQYTLKEKREKLTSLRTILLGGAPISADLEKELAIAGNNCIGFGMTETVSHIAVRKAGDPIYTALAGVSFDVTDGRLIVHDELLGIRDLLTNDAVKLLDSTHFEWLGRTDFVINSGGVKIHPERLEHVIAPLVNAEFFIASRPHTAFGNECILVTESNRVELETIQHTCRQHFGAYAAPRAIVVTPLVRNAGGKIDRRATLRQAGIDL